jgi:hypothetical protein
MGSGNALKTKLMGFQRAVKTRASGICTDEQINLRGLPN